jgi:hypothetical protein
VSLYFIYPEFFFFGQGDHNDKSFITGDRQEFYRSATAKTQSVFETNLETEWFTGGESFPDTLVISRADLLIHRSGAAIDIKVLGGTAQVLSETIDLGDLVNNGEDLVLPISSTVPYSDWTVSIETTTEVLHEFSKIYLCKKMSLGREPVEGSSIAYSSFQSLGVRRQVRSFRLHFEGIRKDKYLLFRERIGAFKGTNPIFLYSTDSSGVFGSEQLVSAVVVNVGATPRGLGTYSVSIDLSENV